MPHKEEAFWMDVNDCKDCLRTELFQGLCAKHSQELEGIVQEVERDTNVPDSDPF